MRSKADVIQRSHGSLAYGQFGKDSEIIARRAVDGGQKNEESEEVMNEWRM